MNSYNHTRYYFKPINTHLKELLDIYDMNGSLFFPDNSDEWSIAYKIRIYKSKELFHSKCNKDRDSNACYFRKEIDKAVAQKWVRDGKCYICLGELNFNPENTIHDIYHEASHLVFHLLDLLNDVGYYFGNNIAREEVFNNLTFAVVNSVEDYFEKLKLPIK